MSFRQSSALRILKGRFGFRPKKCLFLKAPKPNIYSFESMTSRKFFFPDFFPCFAQLFDNFFFTHTLKWRRSFGYAFTQFVPQLLSFCRFIFHKLAPLSHLASIISKFNHTGDFLSNIIAHRPSVYKFYFQEGLL